MLPIRKLPWDSDFFNLSIGAVDVVDGMEWDESSRKGFDLIYIFSQSPLKDVPQGASLVDVKVIFCKNIVKNVANENFEAWDEKKDYQSLLKLAYLSGHQSRFKIDTHFPPGAFELLYRRWLDKSIQNENEVILVVKEKGAMAGFISVEFLKNGKSVIGLVAVDPAFQGKGIGSKLIAKANAYGFEKEAKTIIVATQENNAAAMKLYQKNGFDIIEKKYIYHYWNK